VNVRTIGALAIADIEKATQNGEHRWIVAIRRDAEQKPPLDRIHLHGTLRTAAETFSKSRPDLAGNLRMHLRHLDALLHTNKE
jgi:hypothetical protein